MWPAVELAEQHASWEGARQLVHLGVHKFAGTAPLLQPKQQTQAHISYSQNSAVSTARLELNRSAYLARLRAELCGARKKTLCSATFACYSVCCTAGYTIALYNAT